MISSTSYYLSDLGAHTRAPIKIQKYENFENGRNYYELEPQAIFSKDNHKHTVIHTHTTKVRRKARQMIACSAKQNS